MSRLDANNNEGAVFVEFAIGFMLFLVLLFGIIDLGMLYHRRSEQEYAANQVVQLAAVVPGLEDAVLKENTNYKGVAQPAIAQLKQRASNIVGTSSGFKIGDDYSYSEAVTEDNLTSNNIINGDGSESVVTGIMGTRPGEVVADAALYNQVTFPICKSSTDMAECQDKSIGSFSVFLPVRAKVDVDEDLKEALKDEPIVSVIELEQRQALNLLSFLHPDGAKIRVFASAYRELSQESNMPLAIGCDGKPLSGGNPSVCSITSVVGMSCKYDTSHYTYTVSDANCTCDESLGFLLTPHNKECVCKDNKVYDATLGRCECQLTDADCDPENGSYLDVNACRCTEKPCCVGEVCGENVFLQREGADDVCKCRCPTGYTATGPAEDDNGVPSCVCEPCTNKENMTVVDGICACGLELYDEEKKNDPNVKMCNQNETIVPDEELGCKCEKCGAHSHIDPKTGLCACDLGYTSPSNNGMNCSSCDLSQLSPEQLKCTKSGGYVGYGPCRTNEGKKRCNNNKIECYVEPDISKASQEAEVCGDTEDKNCDGIVGTPIFCCPSANNAEGPMTNFRDPLKECILLSGYWEKACPEGYGYKVRASDTNTTNKSNVYASITRQCGRDEECNKQPLKCVDGVPKCVPDVIADLSCQVPGQQSICGKGKKECTKTCNEYGCYGTLGTECKQQYFSNPEECDGVDNDCNGFVDDKILCNDQVCYENNEEGKPCGNCDKELLMEVCPGSYNIEECSCGPLCNNNEIMNNNGVCIPCGDNSTLQVDEETGNKYCECVDNDLFSLTPEGDKCTCDQEKAIETCGRKGEVLDVATCSCYTGCPSDSREAYSAKGTRYCTRCTEEMYAAGKCIGTCSNEARVECHNAGKLFNERTCDCPEFCPASECSCPDAIMSIVGGECACPTTANKTADYKCECKEVENRLADGTVTLSQLERIGGGCNCKAVDCNNMNALPGDQTPNVVDGVLVCNCGSPCGKNKIARGDKCIECKNGGIAQDTGNGFVCGCDPNITEATYNEETGCKCSTEQADILEQSCNGYFDRANCKCDTQCIQAVGCGYKKSDGYCEDSEPIEEGPCDANKGENRDENYCYIEGRWECKNHVVECVPVEGGRTVKKECPSESGIGPCAKEPICNDDEVDCSRPANEEEYYSNCCDKNNECPEGNELCNVIGSCELVTENEYGYVCLYTKNPSATCDANQMLFIGNDRCECIDCIGQAIQDQTDITKCVCQDEEVAARCNASGQLYNSESCDCKSCPENTRYENGECVCDLETLYENCEMTPGFTADPDNCECIESSKIHDS